MVKVDLSYFDIVKIANSGQAMRFHIIDEEKVEFVCRKGYFQGILNSDGTYTFNVDKDTFDDFLVDYFDLNTNYEKINNSINPNDNYLKEALNFSHGIRILKQDPFETLITFIISQRKSIPSIKACVKKLATRFGHPLTVKDKLFEASTAPYSFPTPHELSKATLKELQEIGVGYRAEYIFEATKYIVDNNIDLNALTTLSNTELMDFFLSFKGVGTKVASCILLFSYHRLDIFPIDVWIRRILDEHYDGAMDLAGMERFSGVIQQYMFYYERSKAK